MTETPDDIRQIWNESNEEEYVMKIDQIRSKSESFATTAKWRNYREYGAAIFVIAMFAYYAFASDVMLIKIGSFCNIAAALYVMAQLKKRSSSTTVNPGAEPIINYHRKQLETERNALRSVWAWYVLPTVPGYVLFTAGLFQSRPDADYTRYFAVTLLIYIFVLLYNAWGANRLQKEIDALPSI
jgi:hypothetical protein